MIGQKLFVSIKKIQKNESNVQVYNMEVTEDNSYTCDNVNTHNCTDISNAGQQKGLEKGSGTRSSLLWECEKAIRAKKPKYLLMENVSALVSQKFLPYYEEWRRLLVSLGYESWSKVLNATDYKVPQNRERIFMVSILGGGSFYFPEPMPLDRCLGDVLEEDVDEKYFLSERMVDFFIANTKINKERGNGFQFNPSDGNGIGKAITTKSGCRMDDNFIKVPICLNSKVNGKQPSLEHRVYDCGGISTAITTGFMPSILTPKRNEYGKSVRREYENGELNESRHKMTDCGMGGGQTPMVIYHGCKYENGDGLYTGTSKDFTRSELKGISRTIKANAHDAGVCDNYRIRKLTPREVFRLMDVDDEDIDKLIAAGISNTQLYKMAGNSIVVNVLYHIFRKMFVNKENENIQLTLF